MVTSFSIFIQAVLLITERFSSPALRCFYCAPFVSMRMNCRGHVYDISSRNLDLSRDGYKQVGKNRMMVNEMIVGYKECDVTPVTLASHTL